MNCKKLGAEIPGFDAESMGLVPIGGGMSSSAALEGSLVIALNELFRLGFDKWQLIKAAQMAEHNFVGIKCGIMDQFACVMGKRTGSCCQTAEAWNTNISPLNLIGFNSCF